MRKLTRITAAVIGTVPAVALAHPGHVGDAGPLAAVHAHSLTEALLLGVLFAGIAVGVGLVARRMQRNRR